MITFDTVTFTYPEAPGPTIRDVDLAVPEGELALVVGETGTGKTTLLQTVNGLVPRFSGGTLRGRVVVGGRDTSRYAVREMAATVGFVAQDSAKGFVTDTVEEELAYTMQQLGLAPDVMRKRVEETLDLMGLASLRHRRLKTLSGGEAQRVAIASVLTAHPPVMVLDEPTSALDPSAAEEVLAAITRLVHDLGTTVVMAEHRLERVIQYADRIIRLDRSGAVEAGPPTEMLATSPVAPPVVRLGRLAGWAPLPLSVRDARRRAPDLAVGKAAPHRPAPAAEPLVEVDDLTVAYARRAVVNRVSLRISEGEVVALMGRNGAGKSSLLWAIQGSGSRASGTVRVAGTDPAAADPSTARRLVTMVPDTPADLVFRESVEDECAEADRLNDVPVGTCQEYFTRLAGEVDPATHPSDLSEGQLLALALAIQLGARPRLLLLDEPTRGLDYPTKGRLTQLLHDLKEEGTAIVVATHDVEFVAETADRVMVIADGDIVADGSTSDVVTSSPVFAPQVAKIFPSSGHLTVDDVAAALGRRA